MKRRIVWLCVALLCLLLVSGVILLATCESPDADGDRVARPDLNRRN